MLVAAAGENKVYELDATGKVVWTVAAKNPWCCAGTTNGHRIISHFDRNLVVEYDATGVEVWRLQLAAQPCSLQRLVNGNTLIAAGQKVTEYRPDRSVAWEAAMPGRPFFARRLADGRTLVSLHDKGRIVEVTRGKVIRDRFKTLRGPYTVIPLENGNWLVCMPGSGRVAELNPAGEEVWAVAGLGWPASACRLENGATLIAHRGGVEEFRPGGTRRFILRVKKGSVFLYRY